MSEQVQRQADVERGAAITSVVATIGLVFFLGGLLAYAYPNFLPGPPEQAVRRFLVGHQAGTWGYVDYVMSGPTELRRQYITASDKCDLIGFRAADSTLKRLRWAMGKGGSQNETLAMDIFYRKPGGGVSKVRVNYALELYGGEWLVNVESAIGSGGMQKFLSVRGVPALVR